ncbi:MAG: hypothetical protein V2B20_04365 [Pseudomonadota bacterium]
MKNKFINGSLVAIIFFTFWISGCGATRSAVIKSTNITRFEYEEKSMSKEEAVRVIRDLKLKICNRKWSVTPDSVYETNFRFGENVDKSWTEVISRTRISPYTEQVNYKRHYNYEWEDKGRVVFLNVRKISLKEYADGQRCTHLEMQQGTENNVSIDSHDQKLLSALLALCLNI